MKITELLSLGRPSMWVKVGRQGRVYFRSVGRTYCNFPLGFLSFFKLEVAGNNENERDYN